MTIPVGVVLPTIVALHLKNMLVAFVLGILLGLLVRCAASVPLRV